jgi:proteasome beta subunit
MDKELKDSILRTGTSIVGIVCKDGVVMAADRQVTGGQSIVLQKNTPKVVQINDYLIGAWAGVAADAQMLKKIVAAELKLKQLKSKVRPTIKEAANLFAMLVFKNIRQFSPLPGIVGTLVGGLDENGNVELYTIDPAGNIAEVDDYDANFGSGMPFMLGFLERNYKKDISVKQGVALAVEALKAATQRDVGSGFGIDVFTITPEGIRHEVKQKIEPAYQEEKAK